MRPGKLLSIGFFMQVLLIIMAFFLGFTLFNLAKSAYEEKQQEKEFYIEYVGEDIIIKNDTLIIMKYIPYTTDFELSNGTRVDESLVVKLMKKQTSEKEYSDY